MPKGKRAPTKQKPNGSAAGIADPFPDRSQTSTPMPGVTAGLPVALPSPGGAPAPSRQLRPILTLFATANAYVLRLDDVAQINLALAIAREIRSGTLIVITPTDTRVFDLGGPKPVQTVPFAPPLRPMPAAAELEPEPMDEVIAAAPQEEPNQALDPDVQAIIDRTAAAKARRSEHTPAAPNATCGRCGGGGVTMAGGTCPVCKGSGVIVSWGRQRGASG